jgi:hypothetical protein
MYHIPESSNIHILPVHAISLFFPDDGGSMVLRNAASDLPHYTISHNRRDNYDIDVRITNHTQKSPIRKIHYETYVSFYTEPGNERFLRNDGTILPTPRRE